ncbi:MAG: hypothetical protein FJY10_09555 [Bacteroidetes bacterium]|nr:hypothetical protein [Bacteroidota bacterium]
MKKLAIILQFLMLLSIPAFSQMGVGTTQPDASAMLDVVSNAKGLLIPRMTNAEMLLIPSPAEGLVLYNTTNSGYYYRRGSNWIPLLSSTNGWSTNGNSGTNPAINFIGTTDVQPLVLKTNNIQSGYISTTGGNGNVSYGLSALNPSTTGICNVAFGVNTLYSNTTGEYNTANGESVLRSNTSGSFNTASGNSALYNNTKGDDNTAIGNGSLFNNTTGSANTGLGISSGLTNSTGFSNTFIGANADASVNNLTNATAIGSGAIAAASNQVVLGNGSVSSLFCQGAYAATTPNAPNMVVLSSGQIMRSTASVSTGSGSAGQVTLWSGTNTLSGSSNLYWNSTSSYLGIGTTNPTQRLDITGSINIPETSTSSSGIIFKNSNPFIHNYLPVANSNNTFVGKNAGNFSLTEFANNNTVLGANSLQNLTTGSDNTVVGGYALAYLQSGNRNVVVGLNTCRNNITGSNNAIVGTSAGYGGGFQSFSNNALFGSSAGWQLTWGSNNILLGYSAGNNLTNGSNNIIIGYDLGATSATASSEVIIGSQSLFYGNLTNGRIGIGLTNPTQQLSLSASIALPRTSSATTGVIYKGNSPFIHNYGQTAFSSNIFIGDESGNFTHTGYGNTAFGPSTLSELTTGDDNVAIGTNALRNLQSGIDNTVVGYVAAYHNTSGSYNTIVGAGAGYGSSLQSYSGNTIVGTGAGSYLESGDDNVILGDMAGYNLVNGGGNVFLGNEAGYNETGNSKLYIDNSDTSTPLIYGDFSTNKVTIHDVIKLAPRASAPAGPTEGEIYVNSSNHHIYCYLNGVWRQLD